MRRYFEDLRVILERHGGTVEKFVGDAVMAVFGIPVGARGRRASRRSRGWRDARRRSPSTGSRHESGSTRARSSSAERERRSSPATRSTSPRGSSRRAATGEVLIGAETRLLVRDAVARRAVEPLDLKGKSAPVDAYRLVDVVADASDRAQPQTPLVGRERERQRLWRDYEDAVADRTCRLFTLLGPAGIGKSRLVADFLERVGDSADVLRGRCLSYGEGITYWPLVEMLVAIGVEPESVVASHSRGDARRLSQAARGSGRRAAAGGGHRRFAVGRARVRRSRRARRRPLAQRADLLPLCRAHRAARRPTRLGWREAERDVAPARAAGPDAVRRPHREPARRSDAGRGHRDRIAAASEGNALYVEEMVAMVREHRAVEISSPPTIHALLQARMDSLADEERLVIGRAAVEGEVFHRGAVAELCTRRRARWVESQLASLVRKELIRPTSSRSPAEEAYRFRHLLIRDAAYGAMPKEREPSCTNAFRLARRPEEHFERDEIVGYHLEQAHRYRFELDRDDPGLGDLAARAARHLAVAGRTALGSRRLQRRRFAPPPGCSALRDGEPGALRADTRPRRRDVGGGRARRGSQLARGVAWSDRSCRARNGVGDASRDRHGDRRRSLGRRAPVDQGGRAGSARGGGSR